MGEDYLWAWLAYAVSAVFLYLAFWRFSRLIGLRDLRLILRALVLAILVTPVPLEPGSAYWAPAFIAALIDFVTQGVTAGLSRLWYLLIAMLTAVVLSFLWRLKTTNKTQASAS